MSEVETIYVGEFKKTNFHLVGDFHEKFGLQTVYDERPGILEDEQFMFRLQLIMEETNELLLAHRKGDVVGVADALADLLYVTYGFAQLSGIPIDRVFAEVHRANMDKVRSTGDNDPLGKRGSKFDVVKPKGWQPPDVKGVLDRA